MNTATQRLLSAPILPTLLRLSAPGILLVVFQSMVSIGDTFFVGRLGTAPLAALALVFPLIMLLQMASAGAMGVGLEALQGALGYRTYEVFDMYANTLGVLLGWAAALLLPRIRIS